MEAICPRLPAECRNMIGEYIRFDLKVRTLEKLFIPLKIEMTNHTIKPRPRGLVFPRYYHNSYKKFYVITSWVASSDNHFYYLTYYNDELINYYFHSFKNKKEIAAGSFTYFEDIY